MNGESRLFTHGSCGGWKIVKWLDKMSNEETLRRVNMTRALLEVITNRKSNWMGHCMRWECLLIDEMNGIVCERRRRG